jgi:cell division protein FtsI (penicillin-binding protein 3)
MIERRLIWLAAIVVLWGAGIFGNLVSLQLIHHRKYTEMARARQELTVELPAPRGTIFDRSGSPLAMSVPLYSVYVNPMHIPDPAMVSKILADFLNLDRTALYGKLKWAKDNRRGFLWIKRKIDFSEAERLRETNLDWICLQTEAQRHYPKGRIAAHVLGSVDFEESGNSGVEKALDAELSGQAGEARMLTDVKRRGIDSQMESEARAGATVTLSIDERIQFVAERELAEAVRNAGALRGSLVAMNPYTGDVLAMASYPAYDPNQPPQKGEPWAARQNQAVEAPFEPGSVFKVFTLATALETTQLRPESPINCNGGRITLFGRTIHDSHGGIGTIPMWMVLAKSSNVGAIQVGLRVGENNFREYLRRFGFGQKTNISLPAESGGRVRRVWGKTSLPSVSMGQEVNVTTLQLARGCSVIANGGLLVRPRLVIRKNGKALPVETPQRVIRPETAITMRQMMENVVMPGGTGTRARLQGYTCGGKTGSAQIYDVKTRHYTHSYNASYMGFAPLTNPAIVMVVTINGTHGNSGFGGVVAAPVFRAVATEALRVLDVPKDIPDENLPQILKAQKEETNDLSIADLGFGEKPLLQEIAEEELQAANAPVQGPALPPEAGPKVPDFKGKSMRAVLAEAAAEGLPIAADGSGVARVQSPPPGAILRHGERIRIQFAR